MNEYPLLKHDQNKSSKSCRVYQKKKYNHSYLSTVYIYLYMIKS